MGNNYNGYNGFEDFNGNPNFNGHDVNGHELYEINDYNITFDAATNLLNDINKYLVTPICGENGDLASGTLKDFDTDASAFEAAMKGATGTQIEGYVSACKDLIVGYVMGLRKTAQDARDGLQKTIQAESENAAKVASISDDVSAAARNARAEADNISTDLELAEFNRLSGNTTSPVNSSTLSGGPAPVASSNTYTTLQ